MRKIAVLAGLMVGICVISVAYAGGAKETKEGPPAHEAPDLNGVIAGLTKKIAALEKRIEKLEVAQQITVLRTTVVPEVKAVPEHWQREDYYGMPYYIVPLAENQSKR